MWSPPFTPRTSVFVCALFMVAAAAAGCQTLIGIDDTVRQPDDAGTGDGGGTGDGAAIPTTFSLSVASADLRFQTGSLNSVTVTVERGAEFSEDVTITAQDLPSGVSSTTVDVLGTESTGQIELTLMPGADVGLAQIRITGTASGGDTGEVNINLLVADAPGVLDRSFNQSGAVFQSQADLARAVAVAPSGRIYVAAKLGTTSKVFAYAQDGTLDTTFSGDGVLLPDLDVYDLVVRPNGGIAIVGDRNGQISVRLYSENGSADATFGGAGEVTLGPAMFQSTSGRSLAVQDDGTVIVAGQNTVVGMLIAFKSDGSIGKHVDFSGSPNQETSILDGVALQADGTVIAGGDGPGASPQPILIRATYSSSNDTWAVLHVEAARSVPNKFHHLDVHSDNTVVHAGNSMGGGDYYVEVYDSALMTSQHVDSGDVSLSGSETSAFGVVFQADGKYVTTAMGCFESCQHWSAALVRYNAAGGLDTSFGEQGVLKFVGGNAKPKFTIRDVDVQPDGRIVATGEQDGSLWILRVWD